MQSPLKKAYRSTGHNCIEQVAVMRLDGWGPKMGDLGVVDILLNTDRVCHLPQARPRYNGGLGHHPNSSGDEISRLHCRSVIIFRNQRHKWSRCGFSYFVMVVALPVYIIRPPDERQGQLDKNRQLSGTLSL
jgi:hypothetical protein